MNALCLHPRDNVVTTIQPVEKGEKVIWADGEVVVLEAIPACHKVAIRNLEADEAVLKYGETIGKTTMAIARGAWVSDRNIIGSHRDYDEEFVKE